MTERIIKLNREELVDLFITVAWKRAGAWDDARLLENVSQLKELGLDPQDIPEEKAHLRKMWATCVSGVENGDQFELYVPDSPAVDSPAVDSPAVDSPAVDSPAVDSPAANEDPRTAPGDDAAENVTAETPPANEEAQKKPARRGRQPKDPAAASKKTRAWACGVALGKFGLEGGVTDEKVAYADKLFGKPGLEQTASVMGRAHSAIVAFLEAQSGERTES